MMKHIPYQQLGKADHGWLKANHHFSFANYYNPERMSFGTLRVINDDWIQAGTGFAPHPHNNMEIITYVRSGEITHEDNTGNKGITKSGEVQVMSAGSGIVHSEHNRGKAPITLYQIWIETNKLNVAPRWEAKTFPTEFSTQLPLLVSGYPEDKDNSLFIYQNARIFGGKIKQGSVFNQSITHQAYVLASFGSFEIRENEKNITMQQGDGAEITESKVVTIHALTDCEILVIDAP